MENKKERYYEWLTEFFKGYYKKNHLATMSNFHGEKMTKKDLEEWVEYLNANNIKYEIFVRSNNDWIGDEITNVGSDLWSYSIRIGCDK